jgi:PadR family transcriptional regulator PadR
MAPATSPRDSDVGVDSWREQIRRGALELAILLTLARVPRYGLEIIRHLEDATDLIVAEGTVYPILARLTRDGLLASEWRDGDVHPRKYYRLTPPGRARLEHLTGSWEEFVGQMSRLIAGARGGRDETH